MRKHIKYILTGAVTLLAGVALSGCVKDQGVWNDTGNKTVTLHLNLDIPGLPLGSRAMTEAQEEAIDYSTVQVLVFEETGSGDVFRSKADITGVTPPTITVKVPTSRASERYRLVLIANMPDQTIADGTPKSDALGQYIFNCSGRWNTSPTPDMIPMWGESAISFIINYDRDMSLLLHRALARVDVGTLFKFNNPDPVTGNIDDTDKEAVWGLANFKIKDIRVYRTLDRAYAASSADRMSGTEVTAPNIPASAQYNSESGTSYPTLAEADQNPLEYILAAGADSFVREIYIPESAVIDAGSNLNNVPCLVVGGYYGENNNTDVTYYRADFATYGNGAVTAYRPILRNHRYVFDIRSVSGPGSETPEEALNSVNAKLDLDIVAWNETPLNYYSNLHYFFEIESRTVTLEAQAQGDATVNSKTVSYDTDLILDGVAKSMTYSWSAGGIFTVDVDYVNRNFIFTAVSDNVGPGTATLTDVLTVNVEDLTFNIYVSQKAFDLAYDLDCGSIIVHGRYIEGEELNYSHHISLTVTSSSDLAGGQYEIKTAEKNGIHFRTEGLFPSVTPDAGVYIYSLELQGYGTLVNESGNSVLGSFDIDIVSNSTNNSNCTARIPVGYTTKRILTIGANAALQYGYMLEPNSASRAFVDAGVNFGSTPESTVTMATNQYGNAFTIEVITIGAGMVGEVINYSYLLDKLNNFQPDIILTGQAINFYTGVNNTNVIELLGRFVDAGGVFLMCNEYYPNAASVNAMVSHIMGPVSGNNQSIGNNQLFVMDIFGNIEDPITNGPFGNMKGLYWGADGHEMHGFTGLPAGTIIYSQRTNGAYNMFRHPTKGFFFMGEGGFISNSGRYIGGTYQGSFVYFPFAIDAQYRPIPRTNYTINRNATVHNSQIFGNILAWAVDYSENYGIVYQEGVDRFD